MSAGTAESLLIHYLKPIEDLLQLEGVTNIFVNRFDDIRYEMRGERLKWEGGWNNDSALIASIHTLARSLNQPIDEYEPLLDARLPSGSRINAVIPPVVQYACMSIRVFPNSSITGEQLVGWNAIDADMLGYLKTCVQAQKNIIISGCVDSGKTTLLKILIDYIPKHHRLVVIEDTTEIRIDPEKHIDYVQREAAQRKNNNQVQLVGMDRLIKNSLRMSPAALVLGEVRDPESAAALRILMNTGIRGILATIHANDCEDTLIRLQDLAAERAPNTAYGIIATNLRRNIDVVVNCTHIQDVGRRVAEIAEVKGSEVNVLYKYSAL